MAQTITINSVDQTAKVIAAQLEGGRRLTYHRVAGSPATLTLFTYDKNAGPGQYRPAIDHSVVVADGATTVFSGLITDIRESALTDASGGFDSGVLCAVTCADQNGLLLRDSYTKTYADGTTVKQILQDLISPGPLGARSITLDGGQANGPAVNGFKFVDAYIDDILNSLTTITGYVWDITPGKVISMIAPGTVSCGFSLSDGGGDVFGGITVEQGRSENYANRIVLVYGPNALLNKTLTVVGNGVANEWALEYPGATNASGNILSAGYVTDNGVFSPLSNYADGAGATNWQFVPWNNSIIKNSGALGVGVVATFVYGVQFPQTVTRNNATEQSAHGVYARRIESEDITDLVTATATADGELSRSIASPQRVQATHRKGLTTPGKTVSCTFSNQNINATFMITEVGFYNDVDGNLTYTLGLVSGSTLEDTWVDYFKRLSGTSGAHSSSIAPISGALVPALSGLFESDVIAHAGTAVSPNFEARLTDYANSAGEGPAVFLGRPDQAYAWAIIADSDNGSTPGTVAKLRFHIPRRGSSIECGMYLVEDTSDNFMLLPGANANLYLGDYAALVSGLSPGDSRIEGILCKDITVTSSVGLIGGQVTFPATQIASSDAHTLDDYEEGTWTPIDSSGAGLSFTSAGGTYTKIGNRVFFECQVVYPATASGLAAAIGGLPFTNAGANGGAAQGFGGLNLIFLLQASSTIILPLDATTNVNATNATLSGANLVISGNYPV